MEENYFLLDKFSSPKNHPLILGRLIFRQIKNVMDIDDLIKKVLKKRKSEFNVIDEARIIQAIGMLYSMGKINYYKGKVSKNEIE